MDIAARHLETLRGRYPGARLEDGPSGSRLLVVPDVPTGPGWNREKVTVTVVVPAGYPQAKLDCFLVDAELRLENGNEPRSSSRQCVDGHEYRWFSWHVSTWSAQRDGFDQFIRLCETRLREAK